MSNEKRTLVTIIDSENYNNAKLWALTDGQIKLLERLANNELLGYGITYETGLKIESI